MNGSNEFKEDRLNFLKSIQILDDSNWEEIELFSKDSDEEIRKQVAEFLGFHHCEQSENILISMLYDDDHLVRTEACDSLYFSANNSLLEILLDLYMNDSSMLVRGYAILALGDIYINLGKELDENLKDIVLSFVETDDNWLKIAVYSTLVKTGHNEYQKMLIEKIDSLDYRDRIFAFNMINEVVFDIDTENIKLLYKKIKRLLEVEKTESVLFSIRNLLASIQSRESQPEGQLGDGSVC